MSYIFTNTGVCGRYIGIMLRAIAGIYISVSMVDLEEGLRNGEEI